MKKVIFSLALLLTCSLLGYAQKGISYQAVILDPKPIEIPGQDITGQPFVNGDVSLKFKIFSSTFVQEFEEVHATQTDAYGLVNVLIGSVSPAAFASLVWDSNPKNMQVWVSFDQGGSYTKVSEQVLTYNPYAIYAETAGKLGGTLGIAAGGTGSTTAADARTNLGLGNVDNTADAAKPISTATQAALDTKANADEVSTALATKASAAEVATTLATKANVSDVTASLALKEDASNKANTPLGSSTTLFPTQNAVKTYVDAQVAAAAIADANGSTKGKIQLAGDLAGTAAAPTVPGLALKANASEVTTALAVKADTAYVLTKVAAATIADASSSTKGKIQLAGDLAGTAAAPTVPGLALKANTAEVNTSLALKAPIASPTFTGTVSGITKSMVGLGSVDNTTDAAKPISTATQAALDQKANSADLATLTTSVNANTASITANTSDILLKANTTDVTTALALKADLESPALSGVPTAPTASAGTNTTQIATTAFVQSSVISNTLSLGDVNVLPTAQGATIVSNVLKLSPANETNSGLVNTSNQTFAGVKTFNDGAKKQITATTANVDQSNITGSLSISTGSPQWQSFTAGTTGILSSVEWSLRNPYSTAANVTLALYEGEGVNGTLLATSNELALTSTSSLNFINFPLTNVVVQAGSIYTMKLIPSDRILFGFQSNNSYSGGKTGLAASIPNPDFLFKTNVKAITSESFITASDVETPLALKADLESPTFTGIPVAPTAAVGTSTTQVATTEFVASALSGSGLPSQSGNSGKVLTTDGSTASWANPTIPLAPIINGNGLTLSSEHNGYIIYTTLDLSPYFPYDLPDGFQCTIVNYSDRQWVSNTLQGGMFKLPSWMPSVYDFFNISPGGTAIVNVVTINGQKKYFILN